MLLETLRREDNSYEIVCNHYNYYLGDRRVACVTVYKSEMVVAIIRENKTVDVIHREKIQGNVSFMDHERDLMLKVADGKVREYLILYEKYKDVECHGHCPDYEKQCRVVEADDEYELVPLKGCKYGERNSQFTLCSKKRPA